LENKVFNPERWAEIIELEESGEKGLVESLIHDYIAMCPAVLEQMQSSVDANDLQTLERLAHSLKSSSMVMGLEFAAQAALQIETEAREKTFTPAILIEVKERLHVGLKELETFRVSRNHNV